MKTHTKKIDIFRHFCYHNTYLKRGVDMEADLYKDNLTGIYNEKFLNEKYYEYISKWPEAYFIAIDLKKFKSINDTFGHANGDACLIEFAKILASTFRESYAIHLHGDEYAILTNNNMEKIEKLLQICTYRISAAEKDKKIPRTFEFNAGCVKAIFDFDETKERADYMMYYAKNNNSIFQPFDESIYAEKLKQNNYLKTVDKALEDETFSYTKRSLFTKDKQETNTIQIFTKKQDGTSIFNDGRYDILKNTSKLIHFDIFNVPKIIENCTSNSENIVISVDYKTLIFNPELINILTLLQDISALPYEQIILNINLNGINNNCYKNILNKIEELKSLGFQICLDKYTSSIGDVLWEESDVEYIKMQSQCWKEALLNKKKQELLKRRLEMYAISGITPIFDYIEKEEEHEFLSSIALENTLFSGNYYKEEEPFILSLK